MGKYGEQIYIRVVQVYECKSFGRLKYNFAYSSIAKRENVPKQVNYSMFFYDVFFVSNHHIIIL